MKERPILFSAPMVRAILEGRKTQTRRIAKLHGNDGLQTDHDAWRFCEFHENSRRAVWQHRTNISRVITGACPHGEPGDRLWVRESCFIWGRWVKNGLTTKGKQRWRFKVETPHTAIYNATHPQVATKTTRRQTCMYWRRPSIHAPRWASRITLEITEVRVQRLNKITADDAIAEGVEDAEGKRHRAGDFKPGVQGWINYGPPRSYNYATPQESFQSLWKSINGDESWDANPWVWAISFKVVARG